MSFRTFFLFVYTFFFVVSYVSYPKDLKKKNRHGECTLARRNSPAYLIRSTLVAIKYLYPRYEVYRGYIVFAFSVIMFVCLFVCLSVNFFFSSKISQQQLGLGF